MALGLLLAEMGRYVEAEAYLARAAENMPDHAGAARNLKAIREYLAQVFDASGAAQLDPWPVGWANVLDEGDWQGPHFHPTEHNVASGVYYVRLPEERPNPEGRIEFT